MSGEQPPSVVVGVDGSRDGLVALDWAVDLAARRSWSVRVVHVVDEAARLSDVAPPILRAFEADDGTDVLEDAADELTRLGHDEVRATFEIQHGHAAEVLLELSRHAGLLVVGRRGMEGFAELVVGSTSQVCAALSGPPVVVVPDCWRLEAPRADRVVVGVDGSGACQPALDFAFGTASMRGAALTVVHAVKVPDAYPPPDLWLRPDEPSWSHDIDLLVAESVAGWSEKYPEVTVERKVTAGHPVQVLATASVSADLVVVGGVGRSRFTPLLLGSVSRGLLYHTACPVAVIHDRRAG
jgi:nucleotide-binding universal stress UspA family protein